MDETATRLDLAEIAAHFDVRGTFVSGAPYGSGHINDTYAAVYDQGGTPIRYIHQRINHNVFKEPGRLMENVARVTRHVRQKLVEAHADQVTRRALSLIPARDGNSHYVDAEGNTWRTYIFVEKARTYDRIENEGQAFEAAKAFGRFQSLLADISAPRLHETIADFHDTPKRFGALMAEVERDVSNRAAEVKDEIAFAIRRQPLASRIVNGLKDGSLPERVTHNDTKLNNVMIDDATGEGICVIDLDTVMPGCALYDFGDMVRSATNSAMEDEQDLGKVRMMPSIFEALARGYLETAGAFLTLAERECLVPAGPLITLETGVRFLTDYLAGDVYFKTSRVGQNLDRCRVQFQLVESMETQAEEMDRVVAAAVSDHGRRDVK